MRTITPYCTCHHTVKQHNLFEDVSYEGEAEAKCKRCKCDRFVYDHQYSKDIDEEAYEQAMRWRMER